jgi:L-threonylcarbamoyladenylate synthase
MLVILTISRSTTKVDQSRRMLQPWRRGLLEHSRRLAAMSTTSARPYKTSVLPCDPASISFDTDSALLDSSAPNVSSTSTRSSIDRAAQELRSGNLVALPTETVYGLASSALSPQAVLRIFAAKGRPADNPLIVHISSLSMLHALLPPGAFDRLPKAYGKLMRRFWPGALTLLFPTTSDQVPDEVTAGLETVAVRMPSHPVARALIQTTGLPLAAPSANRSSRPSPTIAAHVLADLDGRLSVILDGGECGLGVESTVIDGLPGPSSRGVKEEIRVLRPGGVSVEEIRECLQGDDVAVRVLGRDEEGEMKDRPSTPGMKYKHYSPRATVVLVEPIATQNGSTASTSGGGSSLRPHPPPATLHEILSPLIAEAQPPPSTTTTRPKIGFMLVDDSPLVTSVAAASDNGQLPGFDRIDFPLGPSSQPALHAQRLFAGLRSLDEQDCKIIVVEKVKEDGIGLAVVERARKASGGGEAVPVRV